MTNPLRKEPSEFGLNLLRMLLVAILNYATAYGTNKFQGKVKKSFLTLLLSPVVHSKKKEEKGTNLPKSQHNRCKEQFILALLVLLLFSCENPICKAKVV